MRYRVSPWQRALVACYPGYYLVWKSIVVVLKLLRRWWYYTVMLKVSPRSRRRWILWAACSWATACCSVCKQDAVRLETSPDSHTATEKEKFPSPTNSTSSLSDIFTSTHVSQSALHRDRKILPSILDSILFIFLEASRRESGSVERYWWSRGIG